MCFLDIHYSVNAGTGRALNTAAWIPLVQSLVLNSHNAILQTPKSNSIY